MAECPSAELNLFEQPNENMPSQWPMHAAE
jgi:hypothetical protein